ncbi:LCP family protein [Thermus thermamylovorans]|uniref:LytR family transcriptional regulator n=1 Tax=Thermus thermamylovorans TaxID=2509362 RepID=A0A4Q9B547_9DEIN|nr:LCP family protein [Thermus thermamylovorans]TBH20785.1 LytR family transcriptional regulator [Thermus thermamylovorans]
MRLRPSLLLLSASLFALGGVLSLPRGEEEVRPRFQREGGLPEMALVVAGRDIDYCAPRTPCGPGSRTDTILYVRLRGQEARVLAIPRDLYSPLVGGRINAAYARGGAELLKRAVEEATGLVVERHAVITLESAARVVDAVGGVEVYLDRPMRYTDRAAGLYINFPAGRLHLSGEEAVKYMRFRHDLLGDYARLDRIKGVLAQVAQRAQDPRTWPALASALRAAWQELDTDLSLEEALGYLPAVRGVRLSLATLPTREGPGSLLSPDEAARGRFLAAFLGLSPPLSPPEVPVRLRGEGELLLWARAFLLQEGVEPLLEEAEVVRSAVYAQDPRAGAYYADLFHLPLLAPHRPVAGVVVELGRDLLQ